MKICVLLGGASPERQVSLETGRAIGHALRELGHDVYFVDPALAFSEKETIEEQLQKNDISGQDFLSVKKMNDSQLPVYIDWIRKNGTDIVFNATHGGNGENGVVAAHLELAGLPYTGSSFAASSLAMDKYRCKCLFQATGIPTADFETCRVPLNHPENISFPLVIKPSKTGSSVGLFVVKEKQNIYEYSRTALQYDDEILIEAFVDGKELTVPVVAGKVWPVVEIDPDGGVYDYTHKYSQGMSRYYVPARLNQEQSDKVQQLALKVCEVIGLTNYARIDFRMDREGRFYCLEPNTLPGMTATSLLPKSLKHAGVEFPQLLEMIIEDALDKGGSIR